MSQLGAEELLPIGLADDQHDLGIDAVVDPWTQQLWKKLSQNCYITGNNSIDEQAIVIERFAVSEHNGKGLDLAKTTCSTDDVGIYRHEIFTKPELRIGRITENLRTTTVDHFQDVRLITLESSDISYEPGDIIYVRPKNSMEQVEKFFRILCDNNVKLSPNMLVKVSEREIKVPCVLQQTLTLGQIVQEYWDLNFKPRRSTMRTLSFISENELEKEKLHEFTTAAGQEELYNYINRPRRNILEVLVDFPFTTSKLTLQTLFEIMSPIKPRAFSIASSMLDTENQVDILVAVVKYKTKLVEPRFGLCSNWLASLRKHNELIFWIEKGTFKFAFDRPMILIGPGTGVAPFRSLLLERAALGKNLQNTALFFGCRNKEKDFHCQKDFEKLVNENRLNLFCAFSRDQDSKIYVQDIISEQRELCWKLLCADGSIYLAGNSKNMPSCVRKEFASLIKDAAKLTESEAEDYLVQIEKNNRYQTETWG